MKKHNGFTLVELLTVIAVIAILSIFAIPNMISWRNEAKLRGDLNNLVADLQLAKSRALRDKTMVAVIFSADGYRIFLDNGAGANANNWHLDADEALLKSRQFSAGVAAALPTSFDSSNNRTRFNGRGFPDPATLTGGGLTGTITLVNSRGSQKQVTVNRLGRISDS